MIKNHPMTLQEKMDIVKIGKDGIHKRNCLCDKCLVDTIHGPYVKDGIKQERIRINSILDGLIGFYGSTENARQILQTAKEKINQTTRGKP